MGTVIHPSAEGRFADKLSGTPRAHALDRWIYVVQASFFILIVLVGFIPDSMMKIAMVKAGMRAPFPVVLHAHAVLMGSFLLFLLAQSWWVATGQLQRHRKLGPVGGMLAVALVLVGIVLAPTIYQQVVDAIPAAPPPPAQAQMRTLVGQLNNILLLQINAGFLFSLAIALGLAARRSDPGFHKRMMMIAPAMAIGAAFARIHWLPHTIPASPLSILLYQIASLAPLLTWDIVRNRRVHRAYLYLAAAYIPMMLLALSLWDTPEWHATARQVMGA